MWFKLSEFAVSASYPKLVEQPTGVIAANIQNLIVKLLDPVRVKIGKPIKVTSGYRPPKLNNAVKGAKNSNHLYGYAADLITGNGRSDNLKIVYAIFELGLDFDEIIIEKGTLSAPQWIHVALKPSGNRRKFLYSPDGKTYKNLKLVQNYSIEFK